MYHQIKSLSAKSLVKLDWDKGIPKNIRHSFRLLKRFYTPLFIEISRSKNNYHVIIELKEKIPDLEIVLLQLLLGSDFLRERLNFERCKNGLSMKEWNILFKNKTNIPIKFKLKKK